MGQGVMGGRRVSGQVCASGDKELSVKEKQLTAL